MTYRDLREGYVEDLKYIYGPQGNKVKKGYTGSSTKCIEPIDGMVAFYKSEMTTTRSWCSELDFRRKLREAKRKQKY